jgi:hypothetical protein
VTRVASIRKQSLEQIGADTTVQPKAIAHPDPPIGLEPGQAAQLLRRVSSRIGTGAPIASPSLHHDAAR